MSLRNRELLNLSGASVLIALGFVSVFLARQAALSPASLSYLAIFVGIYFAAHLVTRIALPNADPFFLPLAALLTGVGVTMIYRIDPDRALRQGIWVAVGLAVFVVVSVFLRDHRQLERLKYTLGVLAVILLILPAVPGLGRTINGATLWIDLGPFVFQPGEIAKVLLVVFLASYLRDHRESLRGDGSARLPSLKHLGPLLVIWGGAMLVLLVTNDLGSGLLYFSVFVAMLYVATGRLLFVTGGAALFVLGALAVYRATPHVAERVQIWLSPWQDPSGAGYQLVQSLYAISSGGLFGSGLGRGVLVAPDGSTYVPYLETDFIYSALSQELGLVGASAVVLVFLIVVYRGLRTAMLADDGFTKLLAAGLTATLGLQACLITGGVTGLIPLTGITLPFVSYGGSSIVANFLLLALLLAVSDRVNRRSFGSCNAAAAWPWQRERTA
ncbi:MAG: FtsW/RodA/SpoVE family cell cycle protein [Actinomycetia bacterium]|nr:FtsW/RodA/SpoVE family cell cycle protein [Actinomycetes bacterium]